MLMGNYAATAALLAAFDMQLPEGQKPLLPVREALHFPGERSTQWWAADPGS